MYNTLVGFMNQFLNQFLNLPFQNQITDVVILAVIIAAIFVLFRFLEDLIIIGLAIVAFVFLVNVLAPTLVPTLNSLKCLAGLGC